MAIDYKALAAQSGGTVAPSSKYADLAKKYGGTAASSQDAALDQLKTQMEPQPNVHPLDALLKNHPVLRGATDLFTSSTQNFADTLGSAASVATGDTAKQDAAHIAEAESRYQLAQQLKTATPEQAAHIRQQLSQGPNVGTATEANPTLMKSNRQVFGEGIGTGLEALSGGALGGAGEAIGAKTLGQAALAGAKTGAAYGAVGGLSSGMQANKSLGGIAESTALGAGIGGLAGGAIGGALHATPQIYRSLRNTVAPDMVNALTRGIAPTGAKAAAFAKTAETVMPDLLHTSKGMGIDIAKSEKPIDDLLKVSTEAKKGIWKQFEGLLGAHGQAELDGNKIADEMVNSMDKRFTTQNPAAADRIRATADTYRRQIPLNEAEEFLQSANGDLETYYAKNKVGQNAAMKDPEVSHVVKEAGALRDALYGKLDEVAGKGEDARLLKQRYGALTETQGQLLKRQAVLARQKPISLGEQVHYPLAIGKAIASGVRGDIAGAASGLAEAGAAKFIKESQTNEEMIRKAFRAAGRKKLEAYAEVLPGTATNPKLPVK